MKPEDMKGLDFIKREQDTRRLTIGHHLNDFRATVRRHVDNITDELTFNNNLNDRYNHDIQSGIYDLLWAMEAEYPHVAEEVQTEADEQIEAYTQVVNFLAEKTAVVRGGNDPDEGIELLNAFYSDIGFENFYDINLASMTNVLEALKQAFDNNDYVIMQSTCCSECDSTGLRTAVKSGINMDYGIYLSFGGGTCGTEKFKYNQGPIPREKSEIKRYNHNPVIVNADHGVFADTFMEMAYVLGLREQKK